MNIFYQIVSSSALGLFHLFYRLRIYGPCAPPHEGALVAANHASFLDPLILSAIWPEELHFLARKTLFRSQLLSFLLQNLNTHPIQGGTHDVEAFKMANQLIQEGKKVAIFPEGERSPDGQLQPFKAGLAMLALRTGCPIIPVYIQGSFAIWPRDKRWPKLSGYVTCVFGHPLSVEPYFNLSRKDAQLALTKDVYQKIESLQKWLEKGAKGTPP